MSKCRKRKCTDAMKASGSTGSQVDPNNWLDPQYINLQTLPNGLKRANYSIAVDSSSFVNVTFANVGAQGLFKVDLNLPECVGLGAVNNGEGCLPLAGPTGKTKLKFPRIHDVTFRVAGVNPACGNISAGTAADQYNYTPRTGELGYIVFLNDGTEI